MTEPEPVIRDRRRIDPKTGAARKPEGADGGAPESGCATDAGRSGVGLDSASGCAPSGPCCTAAEVSDQADSCCASDGCAAGDPGDLDGCGCGCSGSDSADAVTSEPCCGPDAPGARADSGPSGCCADQDASGVVAAAEVVALRAMVDERTLDLQRLQAEYANYKKRVDRDRALARQSGIENVVLDLLPVLDSVEAAREHDELVGGFKLVADELEKVTAKYGLESFGEIGEPFDPRLHEALMQLPCDGEVAEPTVSAVMQKGVMLHERVLRPARVGVATPPDGDD